MKMAENCILRFMESVNSRHIVFVYLIYWILLTTRVTRAIDPCSCNQLTCDTPLNCTHGVVPDQCSCCLVCARGVGEACGENDTDGICAHGLQCYIIAKAGDPVIGKHQGFCQVIPESCNSTQCESSVKHRCPKDSVLVYKTTHRDNECCKPTYECRCNSNSCEPEPECPHGYTPQILRQRTRHPGSCCNHYYCKATGCWYMEKYHNNGETWKEGDCVTCSCINNTKQCQAEMCMKTCLNPVYVPGRCCPICNAPSLYPNQSLSKCPSLSSCNISCQTGLLQTPDGCHICACKPGACFKDCPYSYVHNENGNKLCECQEKPAECPELETCSKLCNHGYRASKNGCPKCRCHKCAPLTSCPKRCFVGYKTDKHGCDLCECQDKVFEKNCTMNSMVFVPGQRYVYNCTSCVCKRDGQVICDPLMCPQLQCTYMTRLPGECCPTCLVAEDVSAPDEDSDMKDVEVKYIISLSIVGTLVVLLLILVFILLYMKLKHRNQASWSVADQDRYCKCPLFIGQSPTIQNKYDINDKLNYDQVLITKYQPCVTVNESTSPVDKNVFFPEENKNDFYTTALKQPYIKGNGWADL